MDNDSERTTVTDSIDNKIFRLEAKLYTTNKVLKKLIEACKIYLPDIGGCSGKFCKYCFDHKNCYLENIVTSIYEAENIIE